MMNNDKYIFELLENHITYCKLIKNCNKEIKDIKKIRQPNFPESISEYIVKRFYENNINKNITFGKTGDLICDNNKIEVKAFTSSGPSSFGPTEEWNELIFLDAINFDKKEFIIYKINLSNTSKIWKELAINKKETFHDQCIMKRRPRISFHDIKKQLGKEINCIFNGSIYLENDKIIFN